MGKTSNYEKRPRDAYFTPISAVQPLRYKISHFSFCEPCAGDGRLVGHLEVLCDAFCPLAIDIEPQADWVIRGDANNLTAEALENCDMIVTNPPFTWSVLSPLLDLWVSLKPTLLLLPADFMHNKRVAPYLEKCLWIQSVGRVKWIENSKATGVENYSWFYFDKNKDVGEPTHFYGRV